MATLTITTTGAQDSRIVTAFGHKLFLGRDATPAEVKTAVIAYIVGVVREDESNVAAASAIAAVNPIAPT